MSTFELLPAIDLRGGQVVRLRQGDFDQETAYGDDAPAVARAFADAGATWLHVVDLDGARAGEPRQLERAAGIVAEVAGRMQVEVGGGLRTAEAVAGVLGTSAARAVVGTAVLRDPGFARTLVARHGAGRIVASIDVRGGMALGEGWRTGAPGLPVAEAVTMLAAAGITTFEVTAIERDGLLEGPNLDLLRSLVALDRGRIIASGGVSSIGDVIAVQAAGCGGAIVGRALYEGRLDVRSILDALDGAHRA
ncbi:MAG TPA: 1-(5-phosphoribosyl)-5-[(5-phosphoribosylamino)methylideneamino] imidazole-4-carboxamide isomerase [Candidatus Limnocylindrales bacterium]|nr:1-(5-phosphoribosyl)-5-[(5-phosphoribosylamino)methylideneamino] imidazole-4-carboxamide isomerase [Candidatus Limnocylindrales bacterium]